MTNDPHTTGEPVEFDPFSGPEIEQVVPAIEPQLEIWISIQLGGQDANRAYNESVSLTLLGNLDREALERAIRDVVVRHEALRSAVAANGTQIMIYRESPLQLLYKDLSTLSGREQSEWIAAFARRDATEPFDLSNGPLFRPALFRLGERKHYLTLTAHHIICDGWSLGILMQDLAKFYSAYVQKDVPVLPPASSFSEYARSREVFAASPEYRKTEQYWIDQFALSVPQVELPIDYPRPAVRTYASHRSDFPLDPVLIVALRNLGAQMGTSFVTTLLVAFEVYMHRLTGQGDIVLGLPAAGQSASGRYSLVGHCVNLLPLRSSMNGEMTFLDYLRMRKPQILDAYDHQEFTFGSLLKKINIARDPSRVPLVPVVFNIDMGMDEGVAFEGLSHQLTYNPREFDNFEIFLNITLSGQEVVLEWSYNTQLFKSSSIQRMMDEFEFLLRAIVQNPSTPTKDIPLAEPEKLAARLEGWNQTAAAYPRQTPVHDLLTDTAKIFADKPAVYFRDRVLNYRQLHEGADRIANWLTETGIRKGDIVGIALDRSEDMLMAMLGILKSGAAYLPIDPGYPHKRVEYMLSDSGAKVLLTAKAHEARFQSPAHEILLEDIRENPPAPVPAVPQQVTGDDLAYVLYTSGSTGNPKGVQIEHHSLVNFLISMQKMPGIGLEDKMLAVTTISFDISGLELFLPLLSGAQVVIADTDESRDGRLLLDLIDRHGITIMQATPSTWKMMIEAGWEKPQRLRALCGGEPLATKLADQLLLRCQSLYNMYGPTETTIWSTAKQISKNDELITVGRPIDNTAVYILDEYLKPVTVGTIGEIWISGDGVARGYLNRPSLNPEKFFDDTVGHRRGERMYRTGDLGKFLNNGEIQCLGRIDQQIKLHGHRIETGEIEFRIMKLSEIREAVVVVRDDRLVAYVTLQQDSKLPEGHSAAWKRQLKTSLPDYMVPAEFVILDLLPLTANGKIDRNALPAPERQSGSEERVVISPRTPSEKIIAGIWSPLLGVENISVTDDFFELGGHSLIAVKAMSRLEKETGKRLPLASLLTTPTIEGLARTLELDEKALNWNALVPIRTTGSKMPVYIVHGFGMNVLLFNNVAKYMDPDQPVYALQAIGLNGTDVPLNRMEDIAAQYISEILASNNSDSYALAGYSFGGIIAFEMAHQLRAMGKEVKMLAIFDTNIDETHYTDPWAVRLTRKMRRQFPKGMWILTSFAKQPWRTIQYQYNFLQRKAGEWLRKFYRPKSKNPLEDRLYENYEAAYRNYRMRPYDGQIDLFRVKTRLYYLDDSTYLGWKPFASQGVRIHETAGDHKTFLEPPHDKGFARVLQQTLDERTASVQPSGFAANALVLNDL